MKFKEYKAHLIALLKSLPKVLDNEGELLTDQVKRLARNYDNELLEVLYKDDKSRAKFFRPIGDTTVFLMEDFIFFIDERQLDNTYTSYENRIGLSTGKYMLEDVTDVVLNFPYKDCILEGGQSSEEGEDTYFEYDEKKKQYIEKKSKRKEIFFNQILAQSEIDRLKEPKAFTNIKKYSEKGVEPLNYFTRDKKGTIKDNLIIKGNNLLALYSLLEEFKGKVKLIYIDPPYNTGGGGDTFVYNNNFKRSSWLTFMQNRLKVAKQLLSEDGCMIVAIDENEQTFLGVLLNNLFTDYDIHCITIVHNPRGIQGTNFSYTHEYAFFVIPKGKKLLCDRVIPNNEVEWSNLRNWGSESLRSDAKNCFYPIIVDKDSLKIEGFGDVCRDSFSPGKREVKVGNKYHIYPVDNKGVERKWRYARQSVDAIKDLLRARLKNGQIDIEIGKNFGQYRTVWIDPKYDANEYGTKILKKLVPKSTFSFPKSLYNVYDCVYSIVAKDKDAIILDYHAGSGTTAHAVLDINNLDKGNRQFILIEQMDYIKDITTKRVSQVLKNNKSETGFIYLELAENNQKAINYILQAKSLEELKACFETMCEKYFLDYNVKVKDFKERIYKEEEFKKLSLNEQKQIFIKMLDLNQLYVNYSDMEDEAFGLSEEDIRLTQNFYNKTRE